MTEPTAVAGIPFQIASRPQERYSISYSVSNLNAAGSFPVTQLAATGWLRRVQLTFTTSYTTSASAATVAGDAPFNLITGITLTDSAGSPVYSTISGYALYLLNKYLPSGTVFGNVANVSGDPVLGPRYTYAASGTSGSATFTLWLNLEKDSKTGYGSIPNLDSNSSIQLRVDYAAHSVAFTGGTASAATIGMVVKSYYWAPVASMMGGQPVIPSPPAGGEYAQVRYETQTVNATVENLVTHSNRGGFIKGMLLVSRAAGVRTTPTANANFGLILDNQEIISGMPIEDLFDDVRRAFGFLGAEINAYGTPATVGLPTGLDRGVVPVLPWLWSGWGTRSSWLRTVPGSTLQTRFTPGTSATELQIITELLQARDSATFYEGV